MVMDSDGACDDDDPGDGHGVMVIFSFEHTSPPATGRLFPTGKTHEVSHSLMWGRAVVEEASGFWGF